MPATVIVASMLLMLVSAKPSEASQPCMSGTEARQHFGSPHIYLRGQDHCPDVTPGPRHHQVQDFRQEYPASQVGRKADQPSLLPANEDVRMRWVDRWVDIESPLSSVAARRDGTFEAKPSSVIGRKPDSPRAVVLAFIVFILALTLATIELLFRGMIGVRPDR